MICYSQNGQAHRLVDSSYAAGAGEVLFQAAPTTGQLEAAFPGYEAAVTAAQNSAASLATYNAAIAAGIEIVSTGTPVLSGTYALDAASQIRISNCAVYILRNSTFFKGAATYSWPDQGGAMHLFPSTAEFLAFATTVGDYVSELDLIMATGSGSAPAQPVTIA